MIEINKTLKFELKNIMSLKELQMYQNIFCDSQKIYAACYDSGGKLLTRLSAGHRDKQYLLRLFGRNGLYKNFHSVCSRVMQNGEIVSLEGKLPGFHMVGVPIRFHENLVGIWVFAYVKKDCSPQWKVCSLEWKIEEENIQEIILMLSGLSEKFISASYHVAQAEEEIEKSRRAKQSMEEEYKRNAAFTSIMQLLETDQKFEDSAKNVLKIAGEFLEIDGAVLVKFAGQTEQLTIVGEWSKEGVRPYSERKREAGFTGGGSLVSGEMVVVSSPEEAGIYRELMEIYECRAFVAVPVYMGGKLSMCAVFASRKSRTWSTLNIKFLSDVSKMLQSILYKRNAKDSLMSSYTALKEILDNIGSEICVINKENKEILFCNDIVKKVCRMDMVGKKCSDYQSMCSYGRCDCCPAMAQSSFFEEKYRSDRGAWYEIRYHDITWVDGSTVSLCNATDITEKKKYQKRIEFQANNDFLTGLYNRMRCEEDLEISIRRAIVENRSGALLFMDLDNFKHINDGLGHQYGDVLLKTISVQIQQIRGIEDCCYRVGGDEFVIIVKPDEFGELNRILDDLKRIFSMPWYLNENEYYCTMSMGIVKFPGDGRDVNSLIRKADIAMYDAKKSGKNRYEYYNRGEDISMVEKLDIEKNMRSAVAIGCNEFEIYIQPIVDTKTESCIGGEALLRWNSRKLGMLKPGEFIPLAEHLGLITPIGEYVLRKACKANKRWSDMGVDMHINVNLSVVQLLQNNVVEIIRNAIETSEVKPENVVLEVTESLAINDMVRMKKIIRDIKKMGIKIALDDFGTGYSSLNYIKQMNLDMIKVDRTFIKDIIEDDYAQAFVKLITDLSEKLNVRVCVEGVEEKEQMEMLKAMNVSMIQGFYFGKPMPLPEFEQKYVIGGKK